MAKQNAFDILLDEMRVVVREEVRAALADRAPAKEDKPAPEKTWLRAEDLAERYNLPRTFFEEKGREGLIERSKPGRYVLFNVRDVERFLRSTASGGAANGLPVQRQTGGH